MFRVSAVLRRYDADVPPTAVGACCGPTLGRRMSAADRRIVDGGTQWMVLSATINNPTRGNAHAASQRWSAARRT